MLELAYLTDLLQNLRQRSHSLAQLIESTRPSTTIGGSTTSSPRQNYDQSEPLEPLLLTTQIRPPSSISFSRRLRPNITEAATRADPLDFNQFMDDVYRMFPFN